MTPRPALAPGHTPGPWAASETYHKGEPSGYAVHPCHFYFEGSPKMLDEQTLADARLIAAAPELLAAAQGAKEYLECIGYDDQADPKSVGVQIVKALTAAITHATPSTTERE